MNSKNWELAVQLRGKSFQRNLETYRMLTRLVLLQTNKFVCVVFKISIFKYVYFGYRLKPPVQNDKPKWNLAVMHVGAPCCGMNAAVRLNMVYLWIFNISNVYILQIIYTELYVFWKYSFWNTQRH